MMRTNTKALWTLLLIFAFALPCAADESKKDDAKEDTIFGTWHVQLVEGETIPEGDGMRLVFEKDGKVTGFMKMGGEEEKEVWKFDHDEENATLTLYEVDDEGIVDKDPEVILQYSFVDDMLIFRYNDGGDEDDQETMELTRDEEGTKRHQKLRAEQAKEREKGGDRGPAEEPGVVAEKAGEAAEDVAE